MTVPPHAYQQLRAFAPEYAEPLNLATQLTRLPPNDAACPEDAGPECSFPFAPASRRRTLD